MRVLRRAALVAAAVLVVVLIGALASLGDRHADPGVPRPGATSAPAPPPARSARTVRELRPERVLRRVEALRGLRVLRRPRFVVLTPEQAGRRVQRAEERESGGARSAREERTAEALTTLLGLVPPGLDLEALGRRVTTQGTLGFYDGERNEMAIIAPSRDRLPVGVETTLAHELTHAIDDQRYGVLDRVLARRDDADAELAYRSVVEGNASEVEERYRRLYRIPQPDPSGDARQRALLRDLPYGLRLQLGFPYALGQLFVDALRAQPTGEALLARALRTDPPRSTVEILDPSRWIRRTPPVRTPLRPGPVLGRGWTPLDHDTIGAADVLALLAPTEADSGPAALVARAWQGGEYRFYRRGGAPERGCELPCAARDAVVASVALTGPADARSFATRFARILERRRRATSVGTAVWRVGDGGAAIGRVGGRVTFAYAPTPRLAVRLVREAPRG